MKKETDQKTPQQRQKLATLLGKGVPVTKALAQAGWSETQAAKGWKKVPAAVIKALPKSALRLEALGKNTSSETQKNIVRGRLLENTIQGKDKGTLSAKTLGSIRGNDMFLPDLQMGLIVLTAPQSVLNRQDELLKEPEDI